MPSDPCSWTPRISAWFDGESTTWERWRCQAHARHCAACRAWLSQVEVSWSSLRGAFIRAPEAAFVAAVMREVESLPRPVPAAASAALPRRPLPLAHLLAGGCAAAVLTILFLPVLARSRESRRALACQSNLRQIGRALTAYSEDNDERLPPPGRWGSVIVAAAREPEILRCPNDPSPLAQATASGPVLSSYGFMEPLGGRPLQSLSPSATPVVFDGRSGRFIPRHQDQGFILLLSGHIRPASRFPAMNVNFALPEQ